MNFMEVFRKPGAEFRGAPFWAWNGKMDPVELRSQIRIMKRMGLGGFFMHARVGLDTPYLSPDWFNCVKACVDEASQLGMRAWLYDEDRWPSGAAGGIVTKNPAYRCRKLVVTVHRNAPTALWGDNVTAVCLASMEEGPSGNRINSVSRLKKGSKVQPLSGSQVLLVFTLKIANPSPWYNGFTYIDTLNPKAVAEFIKVTHEAYKKNVGADFGGTVPGIFSDEPDHGTVCLESEDGTLSVPWTGSLPAVFRKMKGYDIREHLPELFFIVDGERASRVRYDFNDCITAMFVTAYAKQIGEWCGKHGIAYTGHLMNEHDLAGQTGHIGSCMRFYEHMQAPGIDMLTEYRREYDTAKQVTSVANQFSRKWRLTETYGCTGWDFPFAGHKAIGDWQAALGINLRCQHLAWYTMLGEAKRDYPAGIHYQSPWWELYGKVEDYFARIHAIMTRGTEVRDLLVIHPVESVWLFTAKNWQRDEPAVSELNRMFVAIRDNLLRHNIDFDYGDEEIMARHARVVRRKGEVSLKVAGASYKSVLVPPLQTMRESTLRILRRFKDAGGLVVFAGNPACLIDAKPSGKAVALASLCTNTPAEGPALAKAFESRGRRLWITDGNGKNIESALYLLRHDDLNYYLFVCNTGHSSEQLNRKMTETRDDDARVRERVTAYPDVRITGFADCRGEPYELDPDSGNAFAARFERIGGRIALHTSLHACGSRLFVIPKKAAGTAVLPAQTVKSENATVIKPATWQASLSEGNVLLLDRPDYRIGDGEWSTAGDILRIDKAVRAHLGVPPRGGGMVQPWAREKRANPPSVPVELKYSFNAEVCPAGDLFLAMEMPHTFSITINGTTLPAGHDCGWWCDKSMRTLRLDPSLLLQGGNRIQLKCDYNENHPGLENIYLLGNFGARCPAGRDNPVLTAPVTALACGDWVPQGLPFYSGSVVYRTSIESPAIRGRRVFLRIPDYRGTAVRVFINRQYAGITAWAPDEVEITGFFSAAGGTVELGVEIVGHRRNSHGPFHMGIRSPLWTGPNAYAADRKYKWSDDYQLVECGLMRPPELVLRRYA